jgi:hypothetical protein
MHVLIILFGSRSVVGFGFDDVETSNVITREFSYPSLPSLQENNEIPTVTKAKQP